MPIEIKELHIRVAVNSPQGGEHTAGQAVASAGSQSGRSNGANNDAIISECVEQVMQILQNKAER